MIGTLPAVLWSSWVIKMFYCEFGGLGGLTVVIGTLPAVLWSSWVIKMF